LPFSSTLREKRKEKKRKEKKRKEKKRKEKKEKKEKRELGEKGRERRKKKKKERKKETNSARTILLLGVQDGGSTILHQILDSKVLVALDGEVLNTNHCIDGNPNFVDLVLCEKGNQFLNVPLS
jgi:outer membrane biosynthesis protein TonB